MICPNCTEQEMNEDKHGNKECNECSHFIFGNGKTEAEQKLEKLRARVEELENSIKLTYEFLYREGYRGVVTADLKQLLEKDCK